MSRDRGGFGIGGAPMDGGREVTVDAPIDEIPVFVRMGAVIPVADPTVDTWAPANPPEGVDVSTAEQRAHLLYVSAFPDGVTNVSLADGTPLEVRTGPDGVTLTRNAPPDAKELIAQVVWPVDLSPPTEIEGLTPAPGADPVALEAGSWTWSAARNAAAFHGRPGGLRFAIRCAAEP